MSDKLEDVLQILAGIEAPGAKEFITARKGIGVLLKSYEILKDENESEKLTKAKNLMKAILENYAKRKLLVTAGLPVWSLTLPKTKEFAKFITGKEPKGKTKEKILMNIAKIEVPEELLEKSNEFITRVRKDEDVPSFIPQLHSVEVMKLLLSVGRKPKKGKDGFFEQVQKTLLPGHKYCGSGTDIVANIINGVEPRNYADSVCMLHDIDYLKAMVKFVQSGDKHNEVTVKEEIKKFMRDSDERLAKVGRELQTSIKGVDADTKKTAFAMEKAMEAKILAENTGVLDPLSFLGETVPLSGKKHNQYVLELADILNYDLEQSNKKTKKIFSDNIEEEMPRISVDKLNEIIDVLGARKENSAKVEQALDEAMTALNKKKDKRSTVDLDTDIKNTLVKEFERVEERARSADPEGTAGQAGAGEPVEEVGEEEVKDEPARAEAEEVRDEPARAEAEEEKVSEEQAVLEEGVLKSLGKIERETVEKSQELIEAQKQANPSDAPIIGERSMRPLLIRGEGDQVELNQQQIQENRLWLENFTWVDPGFGNGNQERLPWNFTGGVANNTLFQAQEKNTRLRFSGSLNDGDQQYRHKKQLSGKTKEAIKTLHIPNIQNEQKFIRNGSLPAGLGRPIHMLRKAPEGTSFQNVNMKPRRLVNPDIVRGKRYIRRV